MREDELREKIKRLKYEIQLKKNEMEKYELELAKLSINRDMFITEAKKQYAEFVLKCMYSKYFSDCRTIEDVNIKYGELIEELYPNLEENLDKFNSVRKEYDRIMR